jgi:DNA-binding protein H-NS
VSKEDIQQLSEEEIQRRLSDLENNRAALEKALEQRRQQTKKELAQEIKEMILERGHDVGEIADLLLGKRRGAAKVHSAGRSYVRYVDPANPDNVYKRGVLPRWMKEQMSANGLDPKSREDRETFKHKHLHRLDA